MVLRSLYIGKRGLEHLRFMDFSIIPGWSGYVLWRLGIVDDDARLRGRFSKRVGIRRREPDRALARGFNEAAAAAVQRERELWALTRRYGTRLRARDRHAGVRREQSAAVKR